MSRHFLLLLLLGRKLSAMGESSITPVAPLPEPVVDEPVVIATPRSTGKEPAVVGADLPFPIHVPEIKRDADGRYNRPEFLNYYFEETDLVRGPENPARSTMIFILLARDIENNHTVVL